MFPFPTPQLCHHTHPHLFLCLILLMNQRPKEMCSQSECMEWVGQPTAAVKSAGVAAGFVRSEIMSVGLKIEDTHNIYLHGRWC